MNMEVMSGYKQTEVGVIPEDWECTTVGQLAQNGVIHKPMDGNHGNIHPKSGDFVSFGIPFVMANNVRNGSVDLSNCSFIRKEQADSLQKGFSLPGDVLLTHKATMGNTALVGEIPFEYIMLTPQVTYYRVADRTRLNNQYLRHYFDSPSFQKVLISLSGGGTRAYIGITAQLQLPVVVPPLPQQEAIAEVLSKADALIECLERLIAKKRLLKRGVMRELLTGRRRLRGFADATTSFKQTEVGVIPEDWEVRKLGTLLAEPPAYGINAPAIPYDMRHPTYLRITDISDDGRFIKESKASVMHPEAERYVLGDGDLVFARTGASVGKSYLYDPADGVLVFAGFLICVRPDAEKLSSKFLKFYAHSSQYWNWVAVNSMRTGQPGINGQEYASLPIPLPPSKAEQEAIAEVLSAMDAEIALLEAQLAKYRQIKQGLMQNLLTGRIRLV